jgi:hypothetical protein
MGALIHAPLLGYFIANTPSRLSVLSGSRRTAVRTQRYISAQVDLGHQSQRIDIVVDVSIDVGDRYFVANSS